MNKPDLAIASATTLIDLLAKGHISSTEMLELYLSPTERSIPTYNYVVAFDLERARTEAARAGLRRSRGGHVGALAGLPITIKELRSCRHAGKLRHSGAARPLSERDAMPWRGSVLQERSSSGRPISRSGRYVRAWRRHGNVRLSLRKSPEPRFVNAGTPRRRPGDV